MSENGEEYPVTGLHAFLREASDEFRKFRFQAKVNLIGSIILLLLLSRFLIFAVGRYGPIPFRPPEVARELHLEFVDFFLLLASLAAVLWSLNVWIRQRRFVARWGERFEKLDALEKRFLPDESS